MTDRLCHLTLCPLGGIVALDDTWFSGWNELSRVGHRHRAIVNAQHVAEETWAKALFTVNILTLRRSSS